MIRLAAFDIDGTLVPASTDALAPETVQALQQLRQQGIATVITTGRQWQQVPKALKNLDFDYFVLLNGTHITDCNGRTLHKEQISLENAQNLMRDIAGQDRSLYLRFESGLYSVLEQERLRPFGLDPENVPEGLLEGFLYESPLDTGDLPMAGLAHIPVEEEALYRQNYPRLDFLRVQGGKLCDINPKGISKATGLQQICRLTGIDIAQTIAFGDDINDLALIQTAGIGVAMGNALPEVQENADYVTASCQDLGVVTALRHLGLLGV